METQQSFERITFSSRSPQLEVYSPVKDIGETEQISLVQKENRVMTDFQMFSVKRNKKIENILVDHVGEQLIKEKSDFQRKKTAEKEIQVDLIKENKHEEEKNRNLTKEVFKNENKKEKAIQISPEKKKSEKPESDKIIKINLQKNKKEKREKSVDGNNKKIKKKDILIEESSIPIFEIKPKETENEKEIKGKVLKKQDSINLKKTSIDKIQKGIKRTGKSSDTPTFKEDNNYEKIQEIKKNNQKNKQEIKEVIDLTSNKILEQKTKFPIQKMEIEKRPDEILEIKETSIKNPNEIIIQNEKWLRHMNRKQHLQSKPTLFNMMQQLYQIKKGGESKTEIEKTSKKEIDQSKKKDTQLNFEVISDKTENKESATKTVNKSKKDSKQIENKTKEFEQQIIESNKSTEYIKNIKKQEQTNQSKIDYLKKRKTQSKEIEKTIEINGPEIIETHEMEDKLQVSVKRRRKITPSFNEWDFSEKSPLIKTNEDLEKINRIISSKRDNSSKVKSTKTHKIKSPVEKFNFEQKEYFNGVESQKIFEDPKIAIYQFVK